MSITLKSKLSFGSPGLTTIHQVKGLIEASEANIERLTAQMDEIACMREKEQDILDQLRAMVVPIGHRRSCWRRFSSARCIPLFNKNTLPPYESYEGERGMFAAGTRTVLQDVLRLSQVSAHWRQIVRNTPQLWAEGIVSIEFDRRNSAGDRFLSGLEDWLTRSSLSVSVA
ncbi:hypothetical protein DFH09DRAFT_1093092 [Mycena vulgaris]|nr:hypothetical protein DFH09DRAFT_1093092 [Mycena vulgaris]